MIITGQENIGRPSELLSIKTSLTMISRDFSDLGQLGVKLGPLFKELTDYGKKEL